MKYKKSKLLLFMFLSFGSPSIFADSFIGGSGNITQDSNSTANPNNNNTLNQTQTQQSSTNTEPFTLDKDYYEIKPSIPAESNQNVNIINFMTFGCPYCIEIKKQLNVWSNTAPYFVNVINTPIIPDLKFSIPLRTYFALQAMDKNDLANQFLEDTSTNSFNFLNYNNINYWIIKHNIDRKSFDQAFDSSGVISMVADSPKIVLQYKLEGIPTIVVDGKYKIDINIIRDSNKLKQILTFLSNKVANEKKQQRLKEQ